MTGLVRSELIKLLGLPSAWAAIGVGLLVAPVIAFITASSSSSAGADAGFQELAFGVVGAIILGVVAVSSEYLAEGDSSTGSRQITTSLTVLPSRTKFLVVKAAALVLVVGALALAAAAATVVITQSVLGAAAPETGTGTVLRVTGVVLYWVLTALLAAGITLMTRSGILPLTILVLNTSVVSVTYLLSRVVPAANYLPDLAGARMFVHEVESSAEIAPVTGGLVMTAWVAVVLVAAVAVFRRRDA
ncbi:hypothetical protein AB0M02_21150 [Actinoplanes sp. NPDC051861]|uniref:hypothetical protein n=1 Tax=Actinoplanes sp. NPDC051861 TaxID=3155170 RepID=UPI003429DA22